MEDAKTTNRPVSEENLRAQLQQLNDRARWYSQQYWQVSLAYITAVAVAIVQAGRKDAQPWLLPAVALAAGFVGLFVRRHMKMVEANFKRCVNGLVEAERRLGLRWEARDNDNATQLIDRRNNHHLPLAYIVAAVWLLLFLLGLAGFALQFPEWSDVALRWWRAIAGAFTR